jgi:hypothetical protein
MEKLCEFLAANRDKFRCCGFSDLDPSSAPAAGPADPLRSNLGMTMVRMAQQIAGRWS